MGTAAGTAQASSKDELQVGDVRSKSKPGVSLAMGKDYNGNANCTSTVLRVVYPLGRLSLSNGLANDAARLHLLLQNLNSCLDTLTSH